MPQTPTSAKPPVYLLDTMAFIFRAYHAMQRSRPMSTRTGIPTAATYVFVNMLNKLRQDFNPQYLAAVYDVGRPVHRNELAGQLKDVQKFNMKTQQFEATEYGGYKANRTETPPDLIQQQPYIRRALEAFRIPVVFYEGYEADDVIGTLSCELSALGHHVYVVSSDKDMMQLVNEHVSILNPTKDNLILDAKGVEAVLGVLPEKVIDVMALRGDSVDNIPGAPGIGDKGSVDLIQQFGTVEAAIDAATAAPDSIKRKTYRESLANNRDNILLSKELVTIHTAVPIEADLALMRTQPVDNAACRALFTELEFTTLLKDLAPDIDAAPAVYNPAATAADLRALLLEGCKGCHLAIALADTPQSLSEELAAGTGDPGADPDLDPEPEPELPQTLSLFGPPDPVPSATLSSRSGKETRATLSSRPERSGVERPAVNAANDLPSDPYSLIPDPSPSDPACRIGLAADAHHAIEVSLDTHGLLNALADPAIPKQVHDLKAVLRALAPHNVTLAGPVTDVMLQSYLINPTHGSHTLVDIAARSTSRALVHQPTRENPADPNRLPEAAAAIARLAATLTTQLAEAYPAEREIPHDEPGLGGAVTPSMLFGRAEPVTAPSFPYVEASYPVIPDPVIPDPAIPDPKPADASPAAPGNPPRRRAQGKAQRSEAEAERLARETTGSADPGAVRNAAPGPSSATQPSGPWTLDPVPLHSSSPLTDVYTHLDLPLVPVLLRMERAGVRVDIDLLREQSSRLAVQIDDLAERVYAGSGHRFNIGSPKQLGDILFNKMELPKPLKYGKGKIISTAQDILEDLAGRTDIPGHEIPALVLEHRQLLKLKGTYLDALPQLADAAGRIHTTFNQVGTATGRLSSVNPNLQNIPIRTAVGREIRAAFIAGLGPNGERNLLMSADYSQIELRLMAHFSQDPLLLDAYRTGKDIHTLTAAEVFEVQPATPGDPVIVDKETRARAKAVNFGIVYGISPFGLAANLNIDQRTAKDYIARYFERYAGVARFIETTLEEVRRTQAVRTAFGRIRPIPDIQSRNPNQRGFAERTAVNTPLQGTAADLIKIAMIRIDAEIRRRELRSVMTLQVHDELLFDVVPEEADEMTDLVKTQMESAAQFTVPIVADVGLGHNWRDIK